MDDSNSSNHGDILSFKKNATYINVFFISILGIAVILINGVIIWTLRVDPHRSFNRPKIALDFSTFCSAWLMGFLLAPVMVTDEIVNYTSPSITNEALRTFTVVLTQFLLSNCIILNSLAIIEGVGGLINPHWSRKTFTRHNIKLALAIVFTVNILYQLLILLNISTKIHSMIFVHIFLIAPVIFDSAFFWLAYGRIRRPKSGNSVEEAPSTFMKEKLAMAKARNKKIAANFIKTILSFFTPLVVSSFAYYIHSVLEFSYHSNADKESRWRIVLAKTTLALLYVLPAFNTLAIVIKIPEYRNSTRCALRRAARAR